MKKLEMALVTPVTGVPAVVVLSITWTTRVSAALLFIWAVLYPRKLDRPAAVVSIPLFVVPLIGTSLLARVSLPMVSEFLSIRLLIGTPLLGCIIKRLFPPIRVTGMAILVFLCSRAVARGVSPTRSPSVLAAPFPEWVLSTPFMATRARTTVVDLKQSLTTQRTMSVLPLLIRVWATVNRVQAS